MDYDKNAMRSMGVDPEAWDWFRKDYSNYTVSKEPTQSRPILMSEGGMRSIEVPETITESDPRPARGFKPALFIAAMVWLVLFVGVFAGFPYLTYVSEKGQPTGDESSQLLTISFVTGLLAVFVSIIGALCFNRRLWVRIIGFVLASIPVLAAGGAIKNSNTAYTLVLLVTIVGGAVFGFLFSKSLPYKPRPDVTRIVYRRVEQMIEPQYSAPTFIAAPGAIHGEPGGVGGSADIFGQDAVNAGVKGEKNTAELLKFLMTIPGTSVFHGLRFPDSDNADVDHAVHHGNTVYLLDSKMYRAGTYVWDTFDEKIWSDAGTFKENKMSNATVGYRNKLPYGTDIKSIVIVHGKVSVGSRRVSRAGVMLMTAQEAMEYMGNQMSQSMPTWNDNPDARRVLINNLK